MKTLLASLLLAGLAFAGQAADYAEAVDALIPRLGGEDVPARYPAQMELQKLASQASAPGHAQDRQALGRVLAARVADPEIAQPARVWMVRQLQYMGREEAVPALAGLLRDQDAELRECARRALEQNPARAAETALLAALERSEDTRWTIGLMNSLGIRGSGRAGALVMAALADPETRGPAARALAKIGRPDVIAALQKALNDDPAVANALVTAGSRYTEVFTRSLFTPARAAALVGLARTRPKTALPLLKQALDSPEPMLRHAALNAVDGLGAEAAADLYVPLLPYLTPVARVQVLGRLDAIAEDALIKALKDPAEPVRLMAIKRLGEIGTAEAIKPLLAVAAGDARAAARAAATALLRVRGSDAAQVLIGVTGRYYGAPPSWRVAAIQALTARELPEAAAVLAACVAEPRTADAILAAGRAGQTRTADVVNAALDGLGRLGGDAELLPVAKLAVEQQRKEAFRALEGIAQRVEDREAAVEALIKLTDGKDDARVALLDVFATLGGDKALKLVGACLDGPHATAALRALAKWPDLASVSLLVKAAADQEAPAARHGLALNGALDLVSNAEAAPAAERADALLALLPATRDAAEKKRVLAVMGQVPSPKLAPAILKCFDEAGVKAEAVVAAASLAGRLADVDKAVATKLAKAVQATNPPKSVTKRLRGLLK